MVPRPEDLSRESERSELWLLVCVSASVEVIRRMKEERAFVVREMEDRRTGEGTRRNDRPLNQSLFRDICRASRTKCTGASAPFSRGQAKDCPDSAGGL